MTNTFKKVVNHLLTMPQVTVTKYVKDQLNEIKADEEHTSVDSVLRMLLLRAGYYDLEEKSD